MSLSARLLRCTLALTAFFSAGGVVAAELTVSAAVSLGDALRVITPLYEAAYPGNSLRLNLGPSGALLQQVARGAPVDVLLTADNETLDQAARQGLIVTAERRVVASNALVLVVPATRTSTPRDLADLRQPGFARIAMGLPASVPAGRYARAALDQAGLWARIEPRIVSAQSVRQALDWAARGEVDAAFVYATDAALMADKLRLAIGVATTVPVQYPAAPCAASTQRTQATHFIAFLLSPPAQAVLARYGFGKP
jgi:molybdate transport system substrate-binding protein